MAKKPNARQQRALTEAELKFGPEQSALASLLADTAGQSGAAIKQAQSGAQIVSRAAQKARPELKRIYDSSSSQQSAVRAMLDKDLAAAGPAASSFNLAAQIGAGGARSRTAEASAAAQAEATSRVPQALESGRQEVRNLRSQYASDRSKIAEKLGENAKQRGLFAQTRLADITDETAERKIKKRGQTLSSRDRRASLQETSRHNQTQEQLTAERNRISAQKKATDANGKKWATNEGQAKAKDSIGEAQKHAEQLKAAGRSRSEIAGLLVKGRAATPVVDPKTGAKGTAPALPKIPETYVSAALDLTFGGGVHPATIKKLHDRGIKFKPLGYGKYAEPKAKAPNVVVAPGTRGNRPS